MAIARDAAKYEVLSTGGSGPFTTSFTTSGSNRILFVGVRVDTGSDIISGVTYGGVSMTAVTGQAFSSNFGYLKLFVLHNPASGANDIVVSTSNYTGAWLVAASYTGVKQTGQPEVNAKAADTANVSEVTGTLTTTSDNNWLLMFAIVNSTAGGTVAAGSGTTLITDSNKYTAFLDSNGAKTPAGSYSLVADNTSSSVRMTYIIVCFAPPASGPANLKSYNTNLKANIKSINTNLIANCKSLDTNV